MSGSPRMRRLALDVPVLTATQLALKLTAEISGDLAFAIASTRWCDYFSDVSEHEVDEVEPEDTSETEEELFTFTTVDDKCIHHITPKQ